MSNQPKMITSDQRPAPLSVGGFAITVLLAGTDSAGQEIFFQKGDEGQGPGPHQHPWDEAFYVTKGAVIVGVDEMETTAGPGTFVHAPGGSTHWYKFGTDGSEMISITSLGQASRMFTDYDRESKLDESSRALPKDVAARHGQENLVTQHFS